VVLLVVAILGVVPGWAREADRLSGALPAFHQFDSGIPGLTDEMLESHFWTSRIPNPDAVIMSPAQIAEYNRHGFRDCEVLKDLRTFPRLFSGEKVREMIGKVSARPTKKRYLAGRELDEAYFSELERNLDLAAVPSLVRVRFGVTVRRTEMRTFPTRDRIFSEPDDYEFDRFIETALYPVEPLAILHTSADGEWFLAQAYNYLAWLPVADVALTEKRTLFTYLAAEHSLVVTGKQVFTGFNPLRPEISELQLDMGVRVPLARREEIPMEIDGQHPTGNYVVKLPVRTATGDLEFHLGLISCADDVCVGYPPLTRRNIIRQAFKFLGQRYGWGGMFNTRDCSAFVMDIFKSLGVLLPRNSGEQGKMASGIKHEMAQEMSLAERKRLFDRLPPATPIYMSGHAMLYLWKYQGDFFIIHDFAGVNTPEPGGALKRSKTRSVFVTPLLGTFLSSGKRYIEGLYAAREFVLDGKKD
jgi:hypothetical protein